MTQMTTTPAGERQVTGLFYDRDSAERAYHSLRQRGYSEREITVLMSEDTHKLHFGRYSMSKKALEGAGAGAAVGVTAGVVIGAIIGAASSIALPGIGLVIAGPLAGALAGAGTGGAAGGLVGALVSAGIPEDHARLYDSGIKAGGILMSIKPRRDADVRLLHDELVRFQADHIHY